MMDGAIFLSVKMCHRCCRKYAVVDSKTQTEKDVTVRLLETYFCVCENVIRSVCEVSFECESTTFALSLHVVTK